MSRAGYTEDGTEWDLIRWRGAVLSALRGKRGQAFLVELRDVLDAMPEKKLISGALEADGQHCALGTVAQARGIDMSEWSPFEEDWDDDSWEQLAGKLGISDAMTREIMFMNDEYGRSDEARWKSMRGWVEMQISG